MVGRRPSIAVKIRKQMRKPKQNTSVFGARTSFALYFVLNLPSDRFLSDMAFKFECFFPANTSETEMMMLQGMTYKATLALAKDVDPRDLEVEALDESV